MVDDSGGFVDGGCNGVATAIQYLCALETLPSDVSGHGGGDGEGDGDGGQSKDRGKTAVVAGLTGRDGEASYAPCAGHNGLFRLLRPSSPSSFL